jgi:hypothetical protein
MSNYSSSADTAIANSKILRETTEKNVLKLKNQNPNPSSTPYLYSPHYNITNTVSTVVWSILATSIVYYVFIKL